MAEHWLLASDVAGSILI